MDARDPRDKLAVSAAAAGPRLIDPGGRLVQVGMNAHDRPVGGFDLVDVIDPPHRDLLGQVEPELAEGPLQTGPIQEQVRAAVESQALAFEPRRQAAESGRRPRSRRTR